MIKISKYFAIEELVPRQVFDGLQARAILLIDSRLPPMADSIREVFGPIIINNWAFGGSREFSGWRCDPRLPGASGGLKYSFSSQHCSGRAMDAISEKYSAEEMRIYIKEHPLQFPLIRGIENGVSWLHADLGFRTGIGVQFFNV